MRWTAPPDRREIAIVLLSLMTFFFAYNLDTSFEVLGVDPVATQGRVFSGLGFGKKNIGADGRKPAGWRDNLEADIFGDWQWEQGHVAGLGRERSQPKGTGRHGATWMAKQALPKVTEPRLPEVTVDKALQRWEDDLPLTQVVKHAPGYTILDNVYLLNNTVYLISDSQHTLPPMSAMVTSKGAGFSEWRVLSVEEGRRLIGTYGSIIRGVSWMSADSSPHNSTLFALWRTYSSLDTSIDNTGLTKLTPPHRLIFPHSRFFTDDNPDFDKYLVRRRRIDTGFHPYVAKAAFPQLTVQYVEDWEDYQKIAIPFVFERLVVADRAAAHNSVTGGLPVFSSAFELDHSAHWWEPVRRTMAQFHGEYEISPKAKPVVTYIHSQSVSGLKLSNSDHELLVSELEKMGRNYGYEIHVVPAEASGEQWTEKMTAVVKSSVIIGVHGGHIMDSVFMRPTPKSTVMEFFPSDKYARDQEFAARSLGLQYTAWWGSRSFTKDYPTVAPPGSENVQIDALAIVRAIHEALS